MKKYRDLSIKVRLPIMLGVASLAVLAAVCLFLLFPLRSNSLEDSSDKAQLSARVAGGHLSENINSTVDVLRAYADVISLIAGSKTIKNEDKRELLLSQLSVLGKTGNTLTNVWCILEPNALDGMDDLYINRVGSNAKGIFSPWFAGGTQASVAHIMNTDLYRIPKTRKSEFISDPYEDLFQGKTIKVFSFSVPIILDGIFIGIVATNFDVSELNKLIASLNYNTTGKLITNGGKVAVYHDMERIGQIAEHGNRDILDKLAEGKMIEGMFPFEGNDYYKVYVPIHLGKTDKPWFYAVDVRADDVYAKSRSTVVYLIVFFFISILLITLAGSFLVNPILNRVISITGIIRQLALGRIHHLQIGSQHSDDEIGKMKNELNHLVEGLKHTADFAQKIGNGKFDTEYRMLSDDDMLGNSLLEMRKSLQNAAKEQSVRAKEEEQRSWGTEGLAKFAEILRRDNDNLESLSYNVINNMVNYLGANQGGIFMINHTEDEADKVLEMKACYAYNRKKFMIKQIHPGEGLVGACYVEGQTIYLTEIPDDYINITSGLGDANPRAICICPLKVNDVIYGVVELASFRTFEPYQIEFIEKLSESIAATISSVNVNIRTNQLLMQSKLQTEEMANHEEELRQTMEEMQATQEEMRRRESELHQAMEKISISEKMIKEEKNFYESTLDASLDTMIFVTDLDKKITYINKGCLQALGKTKEQVIGKYCYDVWKVEICGTDRCAIECRKRGITEKIEFNFGDRRLTTQANLVNDLEGKPIGYIEIIEDMTDSYKKSMALQETLNEVEQFQRAIKETNNMIVFSAEGILIDANQNLLDLFESKKSEFVGKHLSSLIGEKTYKMAWNNLVNGKIYEDVQLVTTAAGKSLTIRQKFMPICDKEGKLQNVMLLAFHDQESELRENLKHIAAQKEELRKNMEDMSRHESEMSDLLNKMNLTMDAAQIGLWDMMIVQGNPVNPNNSYTWTDSYRRLLGYSSEAEFPNIFNSWSDKLHPEDNERTINDFAEHIIDRTGKTHYDAEYRLLKKNGEYGYFRAFGEIVRDKAGNAIRVAGGIIDITREKKLMEETYNTALLMEEKSNWYELMLDSINEPISVTDTDKNITFINKAGLDVLGKTREEVVGKHCGNVWGVDICKDHRCGIECMKRGEGKSFFHVDDQKFTTLASYIKNLEGKNIGHLEVIENITESYNQDIAVKDKAHEMQQFQAAVFDSCNIVMFSDEGLITDVNEKLLNIFPGFNKTNFIGKHISEFISKESYQAAWEQLTNGKSFEETQPIDKGNVVQNFHHKYMPICDRNGKMMWILLMLYRVGHKDKK